MNLTLSQAIDGFLLHKEIAGASPYTLRNYRLALRRLSAHFDHDPPLASITTDHIRAFLHQFQTTQLTPAGVAPRPAKLPSPKTVLNLHTALKSFWSWATDEGYTPAHIVKPIQPPKASVQSIQPFTQSDIQALLAAVDSSQPWQNAPHVRSQRPEELRRRDRALILFLLDTGVRASELCALTIADVDRKSGSAAIRGKSRLNSGQGKTRTVYFGSKTRKALWEYLVKRPAHVGSGLPSQREGLGEGETPLFATTKGVPLERRHLGRHLKRLGQRAGVKNTNPHRFRHSFAINYLRNGGDVYTLQNLLGHSSLDMVRRYLKIAEADCATVHRRASPVDNWNL